MVTRPKTKLIKTKVGEYDEGSVTFFKTELEKVRARPQMYIGPTDSTGIFTIIREPCDNGVDEARAGRNKSIHIFATDKDYWVVDSGVGIPVKKHAEAKISTLTHVLTALQSSGKMTGDAYKSAIGCFAGETPIELVDGRTISIRQLYKEHKKGIKNYVWSINRKTGDLRAQPIERVLMTGKTRSLVRVHLDNGQHFDCTPDHPLYQTSLKKIEAAKSENKSLMAIDFFTDADGYKLAKVPGKINVRLNRVVADYYGMPIENRHVHHADENVVNNEPENLHSLTPAQHYQEHPEKLNAWLMYLASSGKQKAKLLSRRNKKNWYVKKQQQGKALKVACRVLNLGLKLNETNFNLHKFHGCANWINAVSRFDSADQLRNIASELLTYASNCAAKEFNIGLNFLASLNYTAGLSADSMVFSNNETMVAKRIIGKATKALVSTPSVDFTIEELNNCFAASSRISARALCQHIDLEEFVSAVRNDVDACDFMYADLSDYAKIQRRNKYDKEEAKSKSLGWDNATIHRTANRFLRNLNAMLSDGENITQSSYHERFKNAIGNSGWYVGVRACYKAGLNSKAEILEAAETSNHKVVSVQTMELAEEVPVYDLSVGIDHNYRLACGVFVGNTHGVGIKATNALSSSFEVWTYRKDAGGWHYTKFESGVEKVAVKKVSKPPVLPNKKVQKLGTIVRFTPDTKIFLKEKLDPTQLKAWCEITAYMNAGLKISLTSPGGKTTEWFSKDGISEYLDKRLVDLKAKALNKKPLFHVSESLDLALSFADVEGTEVQFFTNTIRNIDQGFHAESFYRALTKSLEPFKGKLVYTPTDLKEGLVGIMNYKIDAPQFSSQTKEKLVDVRMKEPCYKECLKIFEDYWKANKVLAKDIVTRASELRKKTSDFLKDKKLIKNVKGASRALSTKMADVTNNKIPFCDRELFLIEGDSAGGCFVGTTKLKLSDGGEITYEKLVSDFDKGISHEGLAYNPSSKVFEPFIFDTPHITKYTVNLVEVELEDGSVEICTPDHKWLTTNRGWVEAQYLTELDDIQTI